MLSLAADHHRGVQPVHAVLGAGQDHPGLRAHRAGQGRGERRILYRHILRNALIPIATLIGLSLPGLIFSGALITESVFNYPGMGLLFIAAATNQDYPILLGVP